MDIYKLYGAPTATTDALASLDIQRDGHIVAYDANLGVLTADALDDGYAMEVSFASTGAFTSNDTKASILTIRAFASFLTSGGGPVKAQSQLSGLAIVVSAGERIYLHAQVSAAPASARMTAYLFVMPLDQGASRADPRRR